MAGYIDFAALKEAVSIEDVAGMLGLDLKKHGAQFRCECPVHGGGERGIVLTPSKNLFFCFKGGTGGDQLALYAHVNEIDVKQAAAEITAQAGNGFVQATEASTVPNRSTVPPTTKASAPPAFDPEKFRQRLVWHDDMAKLGLTPEIAESIACGFHPQRKKLYYAVRHESGQIAGFIDQDGKPPPQWLPASNVVKLKRA